MPPPAATLAQAWGASARRLSTAAAAAAAHGPIVDVAVVGGGVVGSALAARLGASPRARGLRVALIEPHPPAQSLAQCAALPADARVYAITPSSQRTLADAGGAWAGVASVRAPVFDAMQVWDALGPGYTRFEARHAGADQLGWVVEGRVLQAALFEALQRQAAAAAPAGAVIALHAGVGLRSLWLPPDAAAAGPALPAAARLPAASAGDDAATGGPHALARLELTDGTALRARLVVGADGGASPVRAAAGIGTWGWDYDQRAVVATVATAAPHRTAWQRFLPEGPLALLPLWGATSSVVWSTSPAHAAALCGASAADFAAAVDAALTAPPGEYQAAVAGGRVADGGPPRPFGGMGGGGGGGGGEGGWQQPYQQREDALPLDPLTWLVRAGAAAADAAAAGASAASGEPFAAAPHVTGTLGARHSFPLRWATAGAYVRPRLALVGDAAHSVHPLAGQGLNLGLGDAEELARVLAGGAAAGADPGSLALLRAYEASRGAHNLAMMAAVDAIKRVFMARPGGAPGGLPGWVRAPPLLEPWVVARNVGMALLHAATPLKAAVAQLAMGGRGQ
jgi:ubiquinone biosynthesis monooxygenase Coq6